MAYTFKYWNKTENSKKKGSIQPFERADGKGNTLCGIGQEGKQ